MKPLRVLVVDDSKSSRHFIRALIDGLGTAEVVGIAGNGGDALRLVRERSPDVVTLDLEMPEMDGFSFLRVLMATRPMPVIVVSNDTRRDSVLRALELGALDFVAKAEGHMDHFAAVLAQKLALVRSARVVRPSMPIPRAAKPVLLDTSRAPRYVIAIASSTGGPGALVEIFSKLTGVEHCAILLAQHMPPRFTSTFAERLNRHGAFSVSEAQDGDVVSAGRALLCPGDRCMELYRRNSGQLVARVLQPSSDDRYVPNASRLLASVAEVLGVRSVGVVLTGMGDDGADGAKAIADVGGRVFVESEQTAVVYGMPEAARRLVPTSVSTPVDELPARLNRIAATSLGGA